jgi:hypothetical protein
LPAPASRRQGMRNPFLMFTLYFCSLIFCRIYAIRDTQYARRIRTFLYILRLFVAKNFLKKVHFPLNIPAMFGIITIAGSLPLPNWGEVADSGAPHDSGESPTS